MFELKLSPDNVNIYYNINTCNPSEFVLDSIKNSFNMVLISTFAGTYNLTLWPHPHIITLPQATLFQHTRTLRHQVMCVESFLRPRTNTLNAKLLTCQKWVWPTTFRATPHFIGRTMMYWVLKFTAIRTIVSGRRRSRLIRAAWRRQSVMCY